MKIDKNHTDFEGLRWVSKVIPKNETWGSIGYLQVRDGRATGTDGHRLHSYRLSGQEMAEGLYEVITSKANMLALEKIDEEIEYPEWKGVVTSKEKVSERIELVSDSLKHQSVNYTSVVRRMADEITINYDYLADALAIDGQWNVRIYESRVVLSQAQYLAVILSLRM